VDITGPPVEPDALVVLWLDRCACPLIEPKVQMLIVNHAADETTVLPHRSVHAKTETLYPEAQTLVEIRARDDRIHDFTCTDSSYALQARVGGGLMQQAPNLGPGPRRQRPGFPRADRRVWPPRREPERATCRETGSVRPSDLISPITNEERMRRRNVKLPASREIDRGIGFHQSDRVRKHRDVKERMQWRALPALHVFRETVCYQRQLDSLAPELSNCGENLWFLLCRGQWSFQQPVSARNCSRTAWSTRLPRLSRICARAC